jgi:hypothetical protein
MMWRRRWTTTSAALLKIINLGKSSENGAVRVIGRNSETEKAEESKAAN